MVNQHAEVPPFPDIRPHGDRAIPSLWNSRTTIEQGCFLVHDVGPEPCMHCLHDRPLCHIRATLVRHQFPTLYLRALSQIMISVPGL